MSATDRERRPVGEPSGEVNPGEKFDPSLASKPDVPGLTPEKFAHWHDWLADSYDVPRERLAFAVLVCTPRGAIRRRLYLTAESAYRAVERADHRGVEAHAVLVELRQVGDLR